MSKLKAKKTKRISKENGQVLDSIDMIFFVLQKHCSKEQLLAITNDLDDIAKQFQKESIVFEGFE